MAAEYNPLLRLGIPADNQVGHGHGRAVFGIGRSELLQLDLAAKPLEMVDQQFLLGEHGRRAAPPRPQRAELLQIVISPDAVEGDVFVRRNRLRWVCRLPPHGRHGCDRQQHHSGQEHRLAGKAACQFGVGSVFHKGNSKRALYAMSGRLEKPGPYQNDFEQPLHRPNSHCRASLCNWRTCRYAALCQTSRSDVSALMWPRRCWPS